MESGLSPAQEQALGFVQDTAVGPPLPADIATTINFHPDRLVRGRLMITELAATGRYRSQFETGVSAGGLTAVPGGDRWQWESRMFGGAYDDAEPEERPVYGALNHTGSTVGGSPRFGSCHLRLRATVRQRMTLCYPDSYRDPTSFGTARACDLISALLADTVEDPLDAYVEAQVHGPVLVARDVDAVVLDPSYRGTAIEEAAQTLGCAVRWHGGFRMVVDALIERHPAAAAEYRGPEVLAVAQEVAEGGLLTPQVIGRAARQGDHDQQDLKRVWHLLARFGRA